MKTALALGTFDGVHKGHRTVLELPSDCKRIAVLFPAPPKSLITGGPCSIMTAEDKYSTLKSLGIDEIYPLDFMKVKDMSPKDFLEFLNNTFSPDYISCGFNYHFGKNAAGNTASLGDFCRANGIQFNCSKPVCENGEPISSTLIRNYLKNGEIENANALLTVPFSFTAEVIAGDRRGRTIGFPTINQKYPDGLVRLKFGVYKTKVIFNGEAYDGITDIGVRPTFKSEYVISETFIKNFSGDLYGKTVKIQPCKFIRGEKKFSTLNELKAQIAADINA